MSEPIGTIDAAAAVREGEALDVAKLDAWLAEVLPELQGPLSVAQFPGGYSNLTYLLRKGEHELVLRRPPFGARVKSGHDMGREYRVLAGLAPVYPPAPRPLAQCNDAAVIGAPFYVMQRRRGLIVRKQLPEGITPELLGRMCESLVDELVALHAVDLDAAGLRDLGHPEGYVRRQVEGWTARWHKARTDDVPDIEALAAWLDAHQPGDGDVCLVHNDYKFDNVVLDPDDLTHIRAVLDWEMATVGDPWMDVGTTLGYWAEAGDPELLRNFGITALAGNLTRQQFVDAYAAASGRDVTHALFYLVFGLYKVAVIVQQIYARYRQGHTQDPRFAGLIHLVRVNGEMMTRAIETQRLSGLFG